MTVREVQRVADGGPELSELTPTGLFNQLLESEPVTVREVQRVA